MFDADHHQKGGHKSPIICLHRSPFPHLQTWLSRVPPWRSSLYTQTPQISPQSIWGHPWSSEGTSEPDGNSQVEEIFVRKSQIFGTRVFLGTRQVWGPSSRRQAKVPLKAFPPVSTLSLTSPGGLPGATDPGLLHHLGHSGAGSLLTFSSKDVCFRFNSPKACRLLITRLGAAKARWGWGCWVSWERGKPEPFLSGPLNQMPWFPSSNLPSKANFEMSVLKQRKGTPQFPKVVLFQLFWTCDLGCDCAQKLMTNLRLGPAGMQHLAFGLSKECHKK